MPADKASEKMVESMTNKVDPFNQPDNEWVTDSTGSGGCCTVS